jgi:eukaryotic-like serine/threonine-protein kinase
MGTVLDERYRVEGVIGQGGMGTVYEAKHLTIGRMVALKVLKPENAQKPDAIARLRHEARIVSQLGHPNICEVFDIGQLADGTPYLVMERLRGKTLAERIQEGEPINVTELVEVAIQVLAGLETAHRKNVVHRDMKPDNIFLAERASGIVAKILDFGISKATVPDEQPHNLTRTGMVMGTPYYMAPEQAMGERALDGRVDVWGVGICLFEALTGRRPFVAKNYNALLVQILTVPTPPIRTLRADVPQALATVIERALEKRREQRYQTARELADALTPFRKVRPARRSTLPPAKKSSPVPRPASSSPKEAAPGADRMVGARGTRRMAPERPAIPVFTDNDSSLSSLGGGDDEPTHELPADARTARPKLELADPQSESSSHDRPTLVNEETPTMEENELTVVDPPKFLEHEPQSTRRRT